jgi:hypothetical protein
MARTAAPYTTLTVGGSATDPTGVSSASGAGNGVQVAAARPELTILRVANASGGSGTISVLAGTQPLAPSSGQGPLTVTVANSSTQWIGPFESARFIQSDGSLIAESSVALTVTAFKVNRH